ncbi:MAG: putative 2OG-Fe(II) oxygenase [Pseudohongiellaceae bacterium]
MAIRKSIRWILISRGNLIFFPAWLRHGVRPYSGNRERISIAPNIHCQPKN